MHTLPQSLLILLRITAKTIPTSMHTLPQSLLILLRFAYSLGKHPRWANKLICIIMQNTDLQNYADSQTRWANFQVRKFQSWTSGWASATSWASIGQWLGECY
ncbi:hypothetical protein DEO72_LG11g2226 [Vigna unguiculata]|uniref:Uncharacterized protein n=1 Tax=Vigna unguiculata TaxID=3917 RepID=A0A4D6NTY0_VIGUN|nr:hypothetical protein DEO72_LG11g2226 [Vigna unguiculata]